MKASCLARLANVALLAVCGQMTGCQRPAEVRQKAFEKAGLDSLGATWADAEIRALARKIRYTGTTLTPDEHSLAKLDGLVGQCETEARFRCFADDVLLRKGWLLLELGRCQESIAVFEHIIRDYRESKMDCHLGLENCRPGFGVIEYVKTSHYVLTHLNLSADAARLGIARCHMRLGDYDKASAILENYVPARGKRPPSKDPVTAGDNDEYVARLLGTTARYSRSLPETREVAAPDGTRMYGGCLYDGRVWEIESRRADKLAVLLLAKCRAAQGRADQALILYEQMMRMFPFSAEDAARDIAALAAGKSDQIAKDIQSPCLHYVGPAVAPSMSNEAVERLRKMPDHARRVAAARAYLMKYYGSAPGK